MLWNQLSDIRMVTESANITEKEIFLIINVKTKSQHILVRVALRNNAKFIYHFIYADLIYFEDILIAKKTKQKQSRVEGFC